MSFSVENWWLIPFLVTILTGILCPAIGTVLITHKRLLQVNLISHSVLPGLALALALGIEPVIGGVISGMVGALTAEKLTLRRNENYEAVINTVLAGALGLGVLLIPILGIRIDLEAVLFGDLLTANWNDLLRNLIAFTIFSLIMISSYQQVIHIGLDPEGAASSDIKVPTLRFILGFSTALAIVSSMSSVGVIIVVGLLSGPSLLGLIKSPSLYVAMIRSSVFGCIISLLGFWLALKLNLSPGPLIGVICMASLGLLPSKK
ncbi:metal ABC transporter permease [Prochlorococcus sp. MIT 1223]|uniref:metal ABC transporter permease n=1 Tax=Prochlorococcus sp. MIT 1223 TaxID=3096217 RepID=UPI002A760198|nr:metal ABC transporter permease [Prochlorococcus sp. MIT 1223]